MFFFVWLFSGDTDEPIHTEADRFSISNLNVRFGPGTHFDPVSAISPGEQLKVLGDSVGWLQIRSLDNDTEGWVSERYTADISEIKTWRLEQRAEQQRIQQEERATAWLRQDNSSMAYIMIEDHVKNRLVSPASATFPSRSEGRMNHVQNLGNQRYRINSYADSQNRFGATLRTRFVGEIRQISNDTWRLESLELLEN